MIYDTLKLSQYDKNVFTMPKMPTAAQVAEMSAANGGVWYRGSYYVVFRYGQKTETYLHHNDKTLQSVAHCREAVSTLTAFDLSDVKYTYSAMARQITDWLQIRQPAMIHPERLLTCWHYQRCNPYESPDLSLYDMRSAYWQFCARVRSPIFDISASGKIAYRSLSRDQARRWAALLQVMDCDRLKLLRVAIVGVNAAGWQKSHIGNVHGSQKYIGGELKPLGFMPAALQPMSLMSVRCTHEVTQIQSEICETPYANADCVFSDTTPDYWDSLNLSYRKKASGKTMINRVGAWSCGTEKTLLFDISEKIGDIVPFQSPRYEFPDWHLKILN